MPCYHCAGWWWWCNGVGDVFLAHLSKKENCSVIVHFISISYLKFWFTIITLPHSNIQFCSHYHYQSSISESYVTVYNENLIFFLLGGV